MEEGQLAISAFLGCRLLSSGQAIMHWTIGKPAKLWERGR